MSDYQKILYSVEQSVARITLNRPDKRNALDDQIINEMKDALEESGRDASVRVVVVCGAGKDFSSGADLAALRRISEASVTENVADARNFAEMFIAMRVIAADHVSVRGRALGAECGVATACD